jgi:hypothetical protein
MALFQDERETVRLERWAIGAKVALDAAGGMEVLVLDGGFREGGEDFAVQSWLRLPKATRSEATAGRDGARVWIKSGHLSQQPKAPPA